MSKMPLFLALAITALPALPAAARTPTNNAAAFRTFDLYAERTASANTLDHLNFAGYPASIASPPLLLVMRPTPGSSDSVALFNSAAKDAIYFEVNASQTQSFSTYTISPPQFATSLGTLLMGVNIYSGTGAFNDVGKQLATAIVTFVDGDTTIARLYVGANVRDYFDSGPLTCGPSSHPIYATRPTDPRSAYIYETSGNYYDAQESLLPKSKRTKRIASVRIQGTLLDHFCSTFVPHVYAGSRFAGLSIWPNFTVRNATLQPVVRQSQTTGHEHGGYLFGNTVVGQRRTTDVTACKVASLAMAYTYSGFGCSVDSLNAHLQRTRGYQDDQVAIVTFVSPTGSSIRFAGTGGTTLGVGDRFVVELGKYTNPLATYQVTAQYQAIPFVAGQASRVATHSTTIPSINDPGRVYWNTIPTVTDAYTESPQLRSVNLRDSPQVAAQVESLLVRDIPVQLNVGPSGGHWVVANGWTSSFRPDGSARGTYSIKDPFDPRNFTKLIEGQYRNTFVAARYVVPTGLDAFVSVSSVTSGPPGLSVLASGARRVEVIDPLGRHIMRDAGTGEAVSDIPDAVIEDVASEHDNGGNLDDLPTGYVVDIPTTADGHYTVNVYADNGLSMSASGYGASGVFASDAAVDTTHGATGGTYDILYSGSGQLVVVTDTGTIGVGAVPVVPSFLRVRRSPTTGPVEFVVSDAGSTEDAIDVFDISGRKMDVVQISVGTGSRAISWDWRLAGCRPGVYLARLRSRPSEMTRFVVLH